MARKHPHVDTVTQSNADADTRSNAGTETADFSESDHVILFDMDGVILEGHGTDEIVHDQALEDAIAERELTVDSEIRSLLAGYEYDTDFALGCKQLGIDPIRFYTLREQHSARRAIDRLEQGKRGLYPDADALADLGERYDLGIVSNNYDAVVEFVVDHHGLDMFSHIRGRDVGVQGFYQRKPDPHYLLAGMAALDGVDGLYVGDRVTDVVAATRAGLDAVFVRRSHNSEVSLPIEPAFEIDSLAMLNDRL
jgi:HAD superfamily hydrolase (TIGR01549 family)